MTAAVKAAREVRRARSRARRERQSLGDVLYVLYVTVLFVTYPHAALGAQASPGPGPTRLAAADVEPLLLLALAVGVLVARAMAAAAGGPVVLPPEEARLLLTWPVPRASLVLPALGAALSRALGAGLLVSAALLYVDIRYLGAPAAAVLRDDLALPPLLALTTVLVAWQVQARPALVRLARLIGAVVGLSAFIGFCLLVRKIAVLGFTPALAELAGRGPAPGDLPLSGASTGMAAPNGGIVALGLVAVIGALAPVAWQACARSTPELLLTRSRRADVTRTGLKLGFTSSVYLSRTEPLRRARVRRLTPPSSRRPLLAVAGKAIVQEQGTPVLMRLLTGAAVVGGTLAAAARVTPGPLASTVVWAGLAGAALTVIASRCADPLRLDVDRAALVGAVPVRRAALVRTDLAVSTSVTFAAIALGVVGGAALGVIATHDVGALLAAGLGLALLLAAAGALGALSDDPSPFLPPSVALGYRTSGLIAVLVGCVVPALLLRLPDPAGQAATRDRVPGATTALVAVALAAAALATFRATRALQRGR